MNTSTAFMAGVVGGITMTIIMTLGRILGMEVNLEMMLGTMFGLRPSGGAWVLGLLVHLTVSGGIALLYAFAFEHLTHRAGAFVGAAFGLFHALLGGLVMAAVPPMHWLIPDSMREPGMFLANFGTFAVVAFIVLHVLYGAIVGGLYVRAGIEARSRP